MKINWLGTFGAGQGYSGSSEEMALALHRTGADIRVMRFTNSHEANISPKAQILLSKPFELGEIGICYGFPNAFTSLLALPVRKRIGFTMFETDKLPNGRNEWAGETGNAADVINKLDALFVPSTHNKELFEKSGVKVPIFVIPLGVSPTMYSYIDRPKHPVFTFLQAGVLTMRKNPGTLVSAYLEAFKDHPKDVQLVLKTKSATLGHMTFPEEWNIKIIDHNATREEMLKLYEEADCFVFPSRGEGFGLPVLEAMATGLPTIFSKNSGMADMANEQYNYPIQSDKKSPALRFPTEWGNVGNWYETDFKDLASVMRQVYEHQTEAREKGRLASEWVKENWTYDNTAQKILEVIKTL